MDSPFEQGAGYRESNRLSSTLRMETKMQLFVLKTCGNERDAEHYNGHYSQARYECKKMCSNLY